jgi:hypothetical protein
MSTEIARSQTSVAGYDIDSVAVEHLTAAIRTDGLPHAFSVHVAQMWQAYTTELHPSRAVAERGRGKVTRDHDLHAPAGKGTAGGVIVTPVAQLSAASLTGTQRLALAQLLIASVSVSDEVSTTPPETSTDDEDPSRSTALANARRSILDSLDSLDVLDSKDVARILAPTSEATRSVAQKRRKAGELIGLPIGTRPNYKYPAFQFDEERHKIHDVVRHANLRLHVERDPYGAASWWLTSTDLLDGNSPLEDLEAGQLTEIAVDNVLDYSRRGM